MLTFFFSAGGAASWSFNSTGGNAATPLFTLDYTHRYVIFAISIVESKHSIRTHYTLILRKRTIYVIFHIFIVKTHDLPFSLSFYMICLSASIGLTAPTVICVSTGLLYDAAKLNVQVNEWR